MSYKENWDQMGKIESAKSLHDYFDLKYRQWCRRRGLPENEYEKTITFGAGMKRGRRKGKKDEVRGVKQSAKQGQKPGEDPHIDAEQPPANLHQADG